MTTIDQIQFDKYTALGNDYLVVANPDITLAGTEAAHLCDRRFGAGADGILVNRGPSGEAPHRVQIFNSDGSECERSGNGLRIFSQWLLDNEFVHTARFLVECLAGVSEVEVELDGALTLSMGAPLFDASIVGLTDPLTDCTGYTLETSAGALDVTSVSVGNPHTVVFTALPAGIGAALGHEIATHERFLSGTNVQFVTGVDEHGIDIEIWERGSGRTLASGSSACAAAVAAAERGLAQFPLAVRMAGGTISVARRGTEIWQTGTAHRVFSGTFPHPILEKADRT